MLLDMFGYDRHGEIKEVETTLQKNALTTFDVTLAAMGLNAPAWIAAATMSILYSVVGRAAPLAILIALFFPMLILALCLVYLTRHAPSAGGIFTFSSRFLSPSAGTILGWAYVIACAMCMPMSAMIGAQYMQALVPSLAGEFNAKVISTILIVVFFLVSINGVTLTAKLTAIFLTCEISVIVGLGLMGIFNPQVEGASIVAMYANDQDWTIIGSGVLLGVWMLANFDSAINYIEEARYPVRTVQRSMLLVLFSIFVIFTIASIGWQLAVPVAELAKATESGDGGPIAAIARVYLPPWLSWIAIAVVITSAMAGLQVATLAGSRTIYRMANERHLPAVFGKTNSHHAPWVAVSVLTGVCISFVWNKPITHMAFYFNTFVVTLALSYISALAAFIALMFKKHPPIKAIASSVLPGLAIAVLTYLIYNAGARPADVRDLYDAWYIGMGVIVSGVAIVLAGKRRGTSVTGM